MNNNTTYDEAQIRRDVDTAKVVELLKKWRKGRMMRGINYDILNQDKAREEGKALANKHLNMVKDALKETKTRNPDERKIYELSVGEFKALMVECFEMLKQREMDTSVKEYDKITTKRIVVDDVSTRGGVPVSKEY